MKRFYSLSICAATACMTALAGCTKTPPSDTSTLSSSIQNTTINTPQSPADASEHEADTMEKLDIVQELGQLDYPPVLFDSQGWITHADGQYAYYSADGIPVVQNRGFGEIDLKADTDMKIYSAILSREGKFPITAQDDAALLPYDHIPDDYSFGGIGGVAPPGIFYLDEAGKIQVKDLPEGFDIPNSYPMTLFEKSVDDEGRFSNPYHIWLPDFDVLIGPYPAGSAATYSLLHTDQKIDLTFKQPNTIISGLFWMLDKSSGYYIVNPHENLCVGPFDGIEITDPGYMGGRIGKTYIFYNSNLEELYRADVQSGSAVANGNVPVKIDDKWIVTTLDSLRSLPVSYTGEILRGPLK